jgi:hypothetical protein
MFKRTALLFLMGALAIGFQGIMAKTASAHSLTLTLTPACASGAPVIDYTVTSYDLVDPSGENPDIGIFLNGSGTATASGAFSLSTTPPNAFSGVLTEPNGTVVTATAVALWDDSVAAGQSRSATVTNLTTCGAPPPPPGTLDGRFTGGGKQVGVGVGEGGSSVVKITKGLELDCDVVADKAAGVSGSNNLEINWSDANGEHDFDMEDFVSASCYNDTTFSPTPPVAPIDTMIGVGTGRLDNVLGYTVEFTLEDHGEPGRSDEAAFLIYLGVPGDYMGTCPYFPTPTGDPVALDFPTGYPTVGAAEGSAPCTANLALLTQGNLQAHPDQH